MKIGAVQVSDCVLGSGCVSHFDEGEAARLATVAIRDDAHALHRAVGGESGLKIILRGLITEISDKYVCQRLNSFLFGFIFVGLLWVKPP